MAVLLTINGLLLVRLDVYNMKDKQKNRPLKGFVPVSYTHLDVYKRQECEVHTLYEVQ